jgi:hypothetical protein
VPPKAAQPLRDGEPGGRRPVDTGASGEAVLLVLVALPWEPKETAA